MGYAPIQAFNLFSMLLTLVILIAVPVVIGVCVYRDAVRRGMNAELWTLIAILAPLFTGVIIYLIVRRR